MIEGSAGLVCQLSAAAPNHETSSRDAERPQNTQSNHMTHKVRWLGQRAFTIYILITCALTFCAAAECVVHVLGCPMHKHTSTHDAYALASFETNWVYWSGGVLRTG